MKETLIRVAIFSVGVGVGVAASMTYFDKKYQKQLNAYVKAFKEITGNDADALTYHIDV